MDAKIASFIAKQKQVDPEKQPYDAFIENAMDNSSGLMRILAQKALDVANASDEAFDALQE